MNAAVTFESEWMADGTLRLRFLDAEETILGQQVVASDGLMTLHLLLILAVFKVANADLQAVLNAFHQAGSNVDLSDITALLESTRVRASLTPEGNFGLNAIEDDDQDDLWL